MPEMIGDEGAQKPPEPEDASASQAVADSPQETPAVSFPNPPDIEPASQQVAGPTRTEPLLNPHEAKDILAAIARSASPQDPVLTRLATTAVLTGSYERSLFYSDVADDTGRTAVKDVLCWLLILEADYLNYSGGGQPAGKSLSQLLVQTRQLLESAKLSLIPLKQTLEQAIGDSRVDDIQAINDVQARFQATVEKVEGIVTALSEPETRAGDYTHQKFVAPTTAPEKEEHARGKGKGKAKRKPGQKENLIKTVIALVFAAAVLAASGLYVWSLLTRKVTLVIYDPNEFKDIIVLKEARIEGTAFVGVVDDTFWNGLSMDEKRDRVSRLLMRVQGGTVAGILLRAAGGQVLVTTYGNEVRVFR